MRLTIEQALTHRWFEMAPIGTKVNPSIFRGLKKYKSPGKLWQELMKVMVKYLSY